MSVVVTIDIAEAVHRLTVKAMLEASGYQVTLDTREAAPPDLVISDNITHAIQFAKESTTLILAPMDKVPDAIKAMEEGVFGYILLPFQPGEVPVMVQRALEARNVAPREQQYSNEAMRSLAEVEQRHILQTLRACKYNQARTARILGIGRNTLWRKLRQYQDEQL